MKSPFTGKEMSIVKEWRTMSFRKVEFRVLFHVYRCDDTGEQFEDEAFAQLNYNQLINQYRVKFSIPFPEQMRKIRERYALSAVKMSEILGFGPNGYRQYEGGEVPNQSNAKLIQLADDPHEFKKLIAYSASLDQKVKERTLKTIDNLIEEQKRNKFERQLESYFFGTCTPNVFTGFKMPDFRKFSEIVLFFTIHLEPWKTKLNKLLFYTDFTHFKQTGFSMSGVPYRAIPMGPVPNNYNSIFEYLVNRAEIEIHYTNYSDGGIGEQFKPSPGKTFNSELFTDYELEILEQITKRFKNTSSSEIIRISHEEKAWIENNEERKLIDYNYSFDLV